MCKDNTIIVSWSWVGVLVGMFFIAAGVIATRAGVTLTWGEIIIIPFVLTFFLNKKRHYSFTESGSTVKWILCKRTILEEDIQQIDVFETKSGTWIVVALKDAQDIVSWAGRKELLIHYLQNRGRCFLIPLQWGERDKALHILRECYPTKIIQ